MKFLLTCLTMLLVFPEVIGTRRRVLFKNCPASKTDSDFISIRKTLNKNECTMHCLNNPGCLSASFCNAGNGYTCRLSAMYTNGSCSELETDDACSQVAILDPCENGGTFIPQNRICQCTEGFVGEYCHRRYRDCSEAPNTSGIQYLIQPLWSDHVYEWKCVNNATMVTVFSNKTSINYSMSWYQAKRANPYKPSGSFFIGLENLHQLTSQGVYDLQVCLSTHTDGGCVSYGHFRVDSEAEGYALHWDDFKRIYRSHYFYNNDMALDGFGGVGNMSKNLNGSRFGTYDNDVNGCAAAQNTSWWYNPRGCTAIIFTSNGLFWPTNRNGTVGMDFMEFTGLSLRPVYWYEEDDLIL